MLLRIQRYNYDLKYVPGKDISLADALSRVTPCPEGEIKDLDISIHEIHSQINASPSRIIEIKEETAKDAVLSLLRETIMTGWPETLKDCPSSLHGYWNYRDELAVEDGLILKGTRIVVPKAMRPAVLEQLHYAHQGIEKCKLRAKGSVFWDGINNDIENAVRKCPACQAHQPSQQKETLLPHDIPPRPWHTLATDLFHWEAETYLLVADMFSKFPLIRRLTSMSSRSVISHMKGIFEEHGIPEKVLSDNGTQYASEEFQVFAKSYGFQHVTSSPHFPRANGFVERMVQTVKSIFTKCKETRSDPHLAMLCYRTTPLDHNIASPSELLT